MDQNPPNSDSDSGIVEQPRAVRRPTRRRRVDFIPSIENASVVDVETAFYQRGPSMKGPIAILVILALSVLLFLLVGCSTVTVAHGEIITGKDYEVSNVHRLAPKLPERMRRVAMLPVSTEPGNSDMNLGRESLEPILQSEFDRLNVFEVIRVTPDQMRHFAGKADWSANEKLPQNFLSTIKQETGCDAILFSRLTRYHAYPPMAVGWNLKLVDATDGQVWWAADEMFDLADPRVVTSARRYQLEHQKYYQANPELADSRTALVSPRRLAAYSAATLFATLPER
jgi:hypothetical protein